MPNNFADEKTPAAVALAALLFLAGVAYLSIALLQPPRAVAEGAPPAEFSSGRALRHLREIAQRPHPSGSEEHARVQRYIMDELRALGVEPQVQAAEVVPRQSAAGWPVVAARVENVVARLAGTRGGGKALMLAAHYDSVPTAPGASDDGGGVVTLLETLRALRAGPPLRIDLILLFTDAEEIGLVGAQGFAEQHPWMKEVGLVLNVEGRGAGGPSLMFETSEGNGPVIRELAAAAPHVVANSLMYAVYKRLPNDTDMTVFKEAGAAGLNFAYVGRVQSYHTMLDTVEALDERSLQHHGSYALALARHFGNLDLTGLKARDAVYFNAFGPLFVHYSEAWVVPLTTLVALLFAWVMLAGRRRGVLDAKGVLKGFVAFAVAAAGAWVVVTACWRAARALHEGAASLPARTPYNLWLYELGFVLLAFGACAAVYARLFRGAGAANLAAGALAWWLLLLLLTTAVLPLGSYMYAWPLLFALVGLMLVFASREQSLTSRRGLVVAAACAMPAVAFVAPLVYMLFMLLGPGLAGFFVLPVALAAGLLVPHLRALTAARRWLLPGALALAGLGFVAAALLTAGFDAQRKRTNNVFYHLDADAGRARWLSADAAPDAWTSQFIAGVARRESIADIFPWASQTFWQAAAPAAPLPAPAVEVLEDRAGGGVRTLRLRLSSPRRAPMLLVYTDPATRVLSAALNNKPVIEAGEQTLSDRPVGLRLAYAALPHEGIELRLETRAADPFKLVVQDLSFGLPEIPGHPFRPRDETMMPAPNYRASDTTIVGKTIEK